MYKTVVNGLFVYFLSPPKSFYFSKHFFYFLVVLKHQVPAMHSTLTSSSHGRSI